MIFLPAHKSGPKSSVPSSEGSVAPLTPTSMALLSAMRAAQRSAAQVPRLTVRRWQRVCPHACGRIAVSSAASLSGVRLGFLATLLLLGIQPLCNILLADHLGHMAFRDLQKERAQTRSPKTLQHKALPCIATMGRSWRIPANAGPYFKSPPMTKLRRKDKRKNRGLIAHLTSHGRCSAMWSTTSSSLRAICGFSEGK